MLGWSIRARACRSASKRASTCRESMPALMSLSATSRLTGSVCSAIQTVPMPPSPICSSSLYGPITVPGARCGGLVDGRHGVARRRAVQEAVGGVGGRQQGLDVGDPGLVPAARLADVLPPAVRVGDVPGGVEDRLVVGP